MGDILRRVYAEIKVQGQAAHTFESALIMQFNRKRAIRSLRNGLVNPRVSLTPPSCGSGLDGGGLAEWLSDISPITVHKHTDSFLSTCLSVIRHVIDAMA